MKKLLLLLLIAVLAASTVSAQRVITNTMHPVDMSRFDKKTIDLSIFRYIFKGWNTICLPISLTEEEVNQIFGEDCRLETLVGIENNGTNTKLNFKDVKPDGLKANTPYILYSTQEDGVRSISQKKAYVTTGPVELAFSDPTGTEVVFGGATEAGSAKGIYGILVKDNSTAAFVDASDVATGIYATRCFIQLNGGETTHLLTSNHLDYNMTSVEDVAEVADPNQPVNVYNISGICVAKNIAPKDIRKLGAGVYVINGKKIWVR